MRPEGRLWREKFVKDIGFDSGEVRSRDVVATANHATACRSRAS